MSHGQLTQRKRLSKITPMLGLHLIRNKAASHGAVSFYLDNFVQARVTKFTYGCVLSTIYNENNPDHYKRRRMAVVDREGDKLIPGSFVDFIFKVRV